jgi:outer membrane lipoprotein carrier protein
MRRRGAAALAMTLSFGLVVLSSASARAPASSVAVEAGPEQVGQPASDKAPAAPTIACAERLAITIQSYYDAVDDFAASFQQQTRSVTLGNASLGADAPSSGTVQFAKPGKMRWRYESPTPSQVISDGKILWIYDAGTREAQRLPVTDGYLTGAALEFLLGDGNILEEFDVRASSCEPDAQDTLELELIPKQAASFESLGLRAKRETGEILGTSLVDLFGNETVISFSDARINLHPVASTFVFEVPKGVAVIDLISAP